MMHALETHNLTKRFGGVSALDRLSIAIARGRITGIVGPNGSGKSTLINVLTGIIPFDAGTVALEGAKLSRIRAHEVPVYGITRTFQEVRIFGEMPVLDNALVVLTERNVFGALFERHGELHARRAETALRLVGLWEKRAALARNLSYGQRKLLEIARAILMEPKLLLLDEPFAGLFPEMVKTIASIMKRLRSEGKTIVLIEHNMQLMRELCDDLIVMDEGKLLAEGKPERALQRRDVREAYLGEQPPE